MTRQMRPIPISLASASETRRRAWPIVLAPQPGSVGGERQLEPTSIGDTCGPDGLHGRMHSCCALCNCATAYSKTLDDAVVYRSAPSKRFTLLYLPSKTPSPSRAPAASDDDVLHATVATRKSFAGVTSYRLLGPLQADSKTGGGSQALMLTKDMPP